MRGFDCHSRKENAELPVGMPEHRDTRTSLDAWPRARCERRRVYSRTLPFDMPRRCRRSHVSGLYAKGVVDRSPGLIACDLPWVACSKLGLPHRGDIILRTTQIAEFQMNNQQREFEKERCNTFGVKPFSWRLTQGALADALDPGLWSVTPLA